MTRKELIALIFLSVALLGILLLVALLFFRYLRGLRASVSEGEMDLDLLKEYCYESMPKVKKRRKIAHIAKKTLYSLSLVLVSALLIFAFCDKMGWIKSDSKTLVAVASGSMSKKNPSNDYLVSQNLDDQFPTFSLIWVEKADSEELKKYDVIVYKNQQGVNIIHRIVRIETSSTGTCFVTKGDANNTEDTYKPTPEDVIGRYTGEYIPVIGVFVLFAQSYLGIATMIALMIGLVMLDSFTNKTVALREARTALLLDALSLSEDEASVIEEEALEERYNGKKEEILFPLAADLGGKAEDQIQRK